MLFLLTFFSCSSSTSCLDPPHLIFLFLTIYSFSSLTFFLVPPHLLSLFFLNFSTCSSSPSFLVLSQLLSLFLLTHFLSCSSSPSSLVLPQLLVLFLLNSIFQRFLPTRTTVFHAETCLFLETVIVVKPLFWQNFRAMRIQKKALDWSLDT